MATVSPSNRSTSSFTGHITSLGNKISHALTNTNGTGARSAGGGGAGDDRSSVYSTSSTVTFDDHKNQPTMSANDRSVSRGREYQSSGRGGAGNIRRSASRDPQSPSAPNRIPGDEDAINAARGREMPFQAVHHQGVGATGDHMMTHMGRGGAGNVRSPSRDVGAGRGNPIPEEEREIIENYDSAPKIVSTGRGGMGNMADRSRSRGPNSSIDYSHSPSRTSFSPSLSTGAHTGAGVGIIPPSPTYDRRSLSRGRELHSSGRGGVGNITRLGEDQASLERVEENERKVFMHSGDVHSTGRGGLANLTHIHSPPPEGAHPHAITPAYLNEFVSSGRGGAGNIRSRSASRDPVNGSVNSDHHGHGHAHAHGHSGLNKLLGKMGIGEKETTVEG